MSSFALPALTRALHSRLAETRTRLLLENTYLQVLDLLTTLSVLLRGGIEANAIARFAMQVAPNPLLGLIGLKTAAVSLALYCWRTRRTRALALVNWLYAILLLWNLAQLVAACALPPK